MLSVSEVVARPASRGVGVTCVVSVVAVVHVVVIAMSVDLVLVPVMKWRAPEVGRSSDRSGLPAVPDAADASKAGVVSGAPSVL